MDNLIKVDYKKQRVLTTQQLAEVYETEVNNIQKNFERNQDRFIPGEHYFLLQGEELKEFKRSLTGSQEALKYAPSLILWTEKGASRHCKILDTDMAWKRFDELEETYFRVKELALPQNLSPQLQVLIGIEIKQKELEAKQKQIEDKQNIQDQHIQTIKDTIVNRDENWRKWVDDSIKKIGFARGNYAACYAEARNESYEMLKDRGHCNIETQLSHLKERLKEAGATQTKINLANKIDVIESDPKLKEIYTGIIKEMFIKYVA